MKRLLTGLVLVVSFSGLTALPVASAGADPGADPGPDSPERIAATPKAVHGTKIAKYLRNAVTQLPVRNEVRTGYVRDKFKHWNDVDRDCQNARSEVLRQETRRRVTGACAVRTGRWVSQYDNLIRYRASALDVDHMVPLAEAWDSGARSWTAAKREAFANDLTEKRTLIAVTASTNRSKGDRDPAEWLPANAKCRYLAQWVVVKYRWGLSVDAAEKTALTRLARACPNWRFTTYRAVVKLVSTGSSGGGGGGGGTGNCTPGYSPCLPPASDYDCAGGGGNGPAYANGPIYVTGSDPYDLDSDGDGVACEN